MLWLTLFDVPSCETGHDSIGKDDLAALVREAVAEALAAHSSEPKDYYTLKEAAERLTLSPSQLREQVAEGEIPPPVIVGGLKRYTREQLDGIRRRAMIQSGFTLF